MTWLGIYALYIAPLVLLAVGVGVYLLTDRQTHHRLHPGE